MIPAEVYRTFWLATVKYDHPPRFGYDWFSSALNKVWDTRSMNVDWNGFESFTRDVLASSCLTDEQKVHIMKEGVAAFTRRGPVEG